VSRGATGKIGNGNRPVALSRAEDVVAPRQCGQEDVAEVDGPDAVIDFLEAEDVKRTAGSHSLAAAAYRGIGRIYGAQGRML